MRFARDAYPLAGVFALVAALAGVWSWWASLPPLILGALTLFFFRDPERRVSTDPDAILSPADGRVIVVRPGRISIFLSVFNVHICRVPVAGRVASIRHQPGRFFAAFRDEASEQNERAVLEVDGRRCRLTLTLVAGWVARRIVCWVSAGSEVAAGERIGLIRFGSRVDIDIPENAHAAVRVGDRVRAGESVIGRFR